MSSLTFQFSHLLLELLKRAIMYCIHMSLSKQCFYQRSKVSQDSIFKGERKQQVYIKTNHEDSCWGHAPSISKENEGAIMYFLLFPRPNLPLPYDKISYLHRTHSFPQGRDLAITVNCSVRKLPLKHISFNQTEDLYTTVISKSVLLMPIKVFCFLHHQRAQRKCRQTETWE